jgi:hypothetical protein
VGYLAGFASSGYNECVSVIQTSSNANLANCIAHIMGTSVPDGKGACTQYALNAGDPLLADCFLGLTGQSHWGYTSCRVYYESN